jgi:hypothetical protein
MSDNELLIPGGRELALPGKALEAINAPLRLLAPVVQAMVPCKNELAEYKRQRDNFMTQYRNDHGPIPDGMYSQLVATAELHASKLIHGTWSQRFLDVRSAFDVLADIVKGDHKIDAQTALKMIAPALRVMTKKKDDPVVLMSFAMLFDPVIDAVGVGLSLWKEVPKHPVVLALAIQRLFHKQVFQPAPSELIDECHLVAGWLKHYHSKTWDWLQQLSNADACLFEHAREEWNNAYTTPEQLAAAPINLTLVRDEAEIKERKWERDRVIETMKQKKGDVDG